MQDFSKIGPNSTGPPNGRPSPSSPDASDSARSSSPITTVPTTTITPGTEEKRDDATRDLDDASASTNHNSDDPRPDQNQTTYLSSARLYAIMFALLLAAIMLTLDTSILGTVRLPVFSFQPRAHIRFDALGHLTGTVWTRHQWT